MATVRKLFGRYNIGLETPLAVYMTYDDVTLVADLFDWENPGPPTGVTITIDGTPFHRDIPSGADSWSPPGQGIQLLPPIKESTSPRFPYTVSVAPD